MLDSGLFGKGFSQSERKKRRVEKTAQRANVERGVEIAKTNAKRQVSSVLFLFSSHLSLATLLYFLSRWNRKISSRHRLKVFTVVRRHDREVPFIRTPNLGWNNGYSLSRFLICTKAIRMYHVHTLTFVVLAIVDCAYRALESAPLT